MTLNIYIGHVMRNGEWKPLKLGEDTKGADTAPQTRHGRRVIRCVASLTHGGKRRVKTWIIDIDNHSSNRPEIAAQEAKAAFEAQANRWKEKILSGTVEAKEEQEEIKMESTPSSPSPQTPHTPPCAASSKP